MKLFLTVCFLAINVLVTDSYVSSSTSNSRSACPVIKFAHGRVKYRQKLRFAKFQCNTGYTLAGDRHLTCYKGQWDGPIPFCVRPTCAKVKAPANGLIYPSHLGGMLNFYCKPGYSLRGANATFCDGIRWNNNLPSCIQSNSEPSWSCDFETEDLCGWSHDLNHDFDWRRQNFQTPSGHIGTGPKFDHTKGEGKDGFYMYIESSSRLENDTARFISPIFDKMEAGLCFTFYYHMYGSSIGQLKVYIKKASETYNTRYLKPLFVQSGNQGDVWKKGTITLDTMNEDFQIIFEGIRGKSYVSDIAIDDVELNDFCPEDDDFSSTTTESYTENISDFPLTESCVNRCNVPNDNLNTSDNFVIACDCVDTCIDNNTCCPDYQAVCIMDASTDYTEDLGFTEMAATTEMVSTRFKTTKQTLTTAVITTTTKPTTTKKPITIPTKRVTSPTKTTNALTTLFKNITALVKNITTGKTTAIPATKTTKMIPIAPKISTKSPMIDINKSNKKTSTKMQTSTILPTTRMTKKPSKPTSKPVVPTQPLEDLTTSIKNDIPEIMTDYEETKKPSNDFSSTTEEPQVQMVFKIDDERKTNNMHLILGVVGSIVFVMLVVLSVIFVARRYSLNCRGFRFRNSRNSDSLSDVRFLATDEVLDFTWRTPEH